MKGSIVRRGTNRYAIILELRDPVTGERKRKWHSFQGSRPEADTERARLVAALGAGVYVEPKKTTLAKYLTEWLEIVRPTVEPRTHERYAEIVAGYLIPALGSVTLSKLDKQTIGAGYARIQGMRKKGAGPLSARTVLHCHRVLSAALKELVPATLTHNPAMGAKRPKVETKPIVTYDLVQTADALEALRGSWMHVPALLGIMCGMRRGEIAGLRWGAVSLDKASLSVVRAASKTKAGIIYKAPKSDKARTVALSPAVVAELRTHRARQAEAMLRLGVRLDDDAFVVAQVDGSPYDPDSITKEWRLLVLKHGWKRIRFHDTRHSHATHMLVNRVHPKIASERLGHSRVGITLDVYSHVIEGMQEEAVSMVDDAMAKALQNRAAKADR